MKLKIKFCFKILNYYDQIISVSVPFYMTCESVKRDFFNA